jgi:hypothetical protein
VGFGDHRVFEIWHLMFVASRTSGQSDM